MNNHIHSVLISKVGSSEILLNLASPPLIASRVAEIESLLISPSCSVYLFLFPGLRMTTLSLFSNLKSEAQPFSIWAFNHMNLYLAPRSIFLSYLAFKASNIAVVSFDGFSLVMRMTHKVDSVPVQMSLALLACNSGTKFRYLFTYFSHPLFSGWGIQRTSSSRNKNFGVDVQEFEEVLKVEFLFIKDNRLLLACLNDHDGWELLDIVFGNESSIWASH